MSEDGVISFDTALPTPPQTPGPSLYQDAGDTFLIAPYWADINNTAATNIFYYTLYRRNHTDTEEDFNLVDRFVMSRTGSSDAFDDDCGSLD